MTCQTRIEVKSIAPAHNKRFGASGGVVSYDTEQVTSSFALVRAFPMPPPARQAATPLSVMAGHASSRNTLTLLSTKN